MEEIGQRLIDFQSIEYSASFSTGVGLAVLLITVFMLARYFVVPKHEAIGGGAFVILLGAASIVSICLVFVVHRAAMKRYDFYSDVAGRDGFTQYEATRVVPLLVLTRAIGWGYETAERPGSLWHHVKAYTVGVGLLEEIAKSVSAVILSALYLQLVPIPTRQQRFRLIVAVFGISGVGFGAVEAVLYFGRYELAGAPVWVYLARSSWCVLLHASWSVLAGVCAAGLFAGSDAGALGARGDSRVLADWSKAVFFLPLVLIIPCLPASVLHGLYDALCSHGSIMLWLVGIVSIACGVIVAQQCSDH